MMSGKVAIVAGFGDVERALPLCGKLEQEF